MAVLVAESPLEFKRPSGRTLKVKTGDRFVVTGNALSQRYGHVLIARERGAHLGVGELISAAGLATACASLSAPANLNHPNPSYHARHRN